MDYSQSVINLNHLEVGKTYNFNVSAYVKNYFENVQNIVLYRNIAYSDSNPVHTKLIERLIESPVLYYCNDFTTTPREEIHSNLGTYQNKAFCNLSVALRLIRNKIAILHFRFLLA